MPTELVAEPQTRNILEILAQSDRAWKIPEVARLLNLHPLVVYKLARTNRLPGSFRIGSAVRVNGQRLAQYLAQQETR